jgi:hypothetical protein
MVATIIPTWMPRFLCAVGHEQWGHDLTACHYGGCSEPVTRVTADGRRYTPRRKA